MRGKLHKRGLLRGALGITPACAGKTSASRLRASARWDHPRVCGENTPRGLFYFPAGGSPPRVRGKHARYRAPNRPCRITPACAGKTFPLLSAERTGQDHPRVCGENLMMTRRRQLLLGSPPRVRGKLSKGGIK